MLRILALPLTGRSIMAIIRYWSRWHKMAKQPKLHQFCGHPIIPISSLFWFPNHAWENKSCVSGIETRDRYPATRQLRPPPPPEGSVTLPRPNGCHFSKYVFNRFFTNVFNEFGSSDGRTPFGHASSHFFTRLNVFRLSTVSKYQYHNSICACRV